VRTLSDTKKLLRSDYLARRSRFIRTCNTQEVSLILSEHALAWEGITHISRSIPIAGYWPTDEEMDPRPLLYLLEERGHVLCLPCVVGDHLIFRHWTSHTPLMPGRFGTSEPSTDAEPIIPQIILVPLIGFNRKGVRLGQGKGYYDRALAALKRNQDVHTLGIAYGCQEVSEDLPQESHDILLDAVATEKELIICRM